MLPHKKTIIKTALRIVWVRSIDPFNYLLVFTLFLLSCNNETIELPWAELDSPTTATLTSIYFQNEQIGHVVGGNTWYDGVYLHTEDGGNTWNFDRIGEKQLFGLDGNSDGQLHTVGIDGHLFSRASDSVDWVFHRTPRYDILRGVDFNENGEGILVGGVAFRKGTVMVVDTTYQVIRIDTFEQQLNAVCFSAPQTVHAVGYGAILRSTDGGVSWEINDTQGDHYRAVSFPNEQTGFIVGANGSILRTTDGGESWSKIRNGDAIAVSDKFFRDVLFIDSDHGFIVGDGGLCWRTEDGGDNWAVVKGLPKFDFLSISLTTDYGFIVGEDGRMIRIQR